MPDPTEPIRPDPIRDASVSPEGIRHQPANPLELERYPPKDATCARVRGLLRDYADGELAEALSRAVELHVHQCRDCGLSLARAEHEVLRLRRAGSEVEGPVPNGFAAATVQRLLRDLAQHPSEIRGRPADPADREAAAGRAGSRSRAGRVPGRHRLLVYSLLCTAAALAISALLFSAYGEVERRSRAVVVWARSALWDTAGGRGGLLVAGEAVPEGARIVVLEDGQAVLRWQVQAGGRQPAAVLRLQGGASVQVEGSEPRLLEGSSEVEVYRSVGFGLADGSRLELERGLYHLDLVDYRAFDDPLDGRTNALRVRLETLRGEGARILRGGGGSASAVAVGEGEVAMWQGWGSISVDSSLPPGALITSLGGVPRRPAAPPSETPALVGSVFERPAGAPGIGARVTLLFRRDGVPASWSGEADAAGAFRLDGHLPIDGGFVVAQLFPPVGRPDLGVPAPMVLPVMSPPAGDRIGHPLALEPGAEIRGVVVDGDQRGILGARVVPCLVDELFGGVLPWFEGSCATDSHGSFELRSLPVSLPAYQRLAVLLLHPDYSSHCHPIPAPGSLAAREFGFRFALEPLRDQTVRGLPWAQTCEIVEELAGMPPGTGVRLHRILTDGRGRGMLSAAGSPGRMWLRTGAGGRPVLRLLERAEDPQGNPVLVPELQAVELAAVLRRLFAVPGSDFLVARTFRGERFHDLPNQPQMTMVAVAEITGRPLPGAELFALDPASQRRGDESRLLGMEDGSGGVPAAVTAEETFVVGVAQNGSLAVTSVGDRLGRTLRVAMDEPGSLVLGELFRPRPQAPRQVVPLVLTRRSGALAELAPTLVRFVCAAEGWQAHNVPPGEYHVAVPGGRTWTVQVVAGQTLALR